MPFWKKSEDPWDYAPERRDPVRREEEPPVSPDGETQDRSACRIPFQSRDAGSQSPPPMACPWCGLWIRGVPTARKFWLGAGRGNIIRVDTEGGLMTPHRTAWLCRACRRMVLEAPGNMWKIPPAENSGEQTALADCRTDETEDT